MYERTGRTIAQRVTLAVLVGASAALAWWLLVGGGVGAIGAWWGWPWNAGDPLRRFCLATAMTIYFVRLLFTEFVFLKRGVGWAEVVSVAPWVFCIFMLVAVSGGTNPTPFSVAAIAGAVLFIAGSWMNTYAEWARNAWKRKPENRGRLYTLGLFRYSRHPNYLGDVLSFSGLCLMTGRWFTVFIPAIMLAGFVLVNIPVLDSHLRTKYGAEFDAYAQRTPKLIPFIY